MIKQNLNVLFVANNTKDYHDILKISDLISRRSRVSKIYIVFNSNQSPPNSTDSRIEVIHYPSNRIIMPIYIYLKFVLTNPKKKIGFVSKKIIDNPLLKLFIKEDDYLIYGMKSKAAKTALVIENSNLQGLYEI